ncbi:hypothetical protein VTJ49DRAFT_3664 [Mycothermus thermophilus]|uniref:Cytochrome P450 n=1 Tax=Humicola insolens TaxID=85995 RepID=A0ABR3V7Z9_HUMIN
MASLTLVLLYLAISSLIFSVVKQVLSWRKTRRLQGRFPGPRLFPIVGRVHDVPRFSPWLKFKEWADEYGPIYYTRALHQPFIIVSGQQIAEELLVKRGDIYSGRPQLRCIINHKEGPAYVALMDRHDTWRTQRKWAHAAVTKAYRHHFYGHVETEMKRYLGLLLLDPALFLDYTREFSGRIMSRLAWDDATQGRANGDSANQTLHCMSASGPLPNTVTPLWHLPGFMNPWYKFEVRRQREQRAWWLNNYRLAKDRMLRGDLPADTWAYRYFEQLRRDGGNESLEQAEDQEVFASCMIGFLNLIGVVPVSGLLKFFLMAMAVHPEWQKKAQARLTAGVMIKKGTIILACEWAMNRVPSTYPDGDNFRPERWLEPGWPTYQEPLTRYPNFREGFGMHTFGWGRRTCLGQNIVDGEVFVFGAATLWAFNLSQKRCPRTGEPVPIDTQATNSHVILEPLPYQINIKVRSEKRGRQVLEGYNEVRTGRY